MIHMVIDSPKVQSGAITIAGLLFKKTINGTFVGAHETFTPSEPIVDAASLRFALAAASFC
jgi:hypothetical protein